MNTVRLDPDLLRALGLAATEDGTTVTALVGEAVREWLARRREPAARSRVPLPTYSGRGLQPGANLDNAAALLDLMDGRSAPD